MAEELHISKLAASYKNKNSFTAAACVAANQEDCSLYKGCPP
ncbi:hypothetical protein Pint_22169 [Pistacia integerrima]|uniref:Uncharacterized protein n=1 Tax=Pistacia integerrima TaxID=434235 RepID=A0ACC0YK87_9ROSI|nr:hypothetical protein Pint_22169 [Pistacia integerrima]